MKWFLIVCAVASLASGMAFGYLGNNAILCVGFFGFVGLLVAANLDRISQFKASGAGIEAHTREIVARAETAVSELQLLAVQVAELSLSLVKRQGRWGGYGDEEQDRIRASIFEVLGKLAIPQSKSEHVLDEWHRIVEFDYAHHILGGARVPESPSPEVLKEWKKLREGGFTSYPSPQTLRDFLTKNHYMTAELEEYIKDFEHYRTHRNHRRPNVWKERDSWGHLEPQ